MVDLSPDQRRTLDGVLEWYESVPKTWKHCHGASDCPDWPHTHGLSMAPVKSLGGMAGTGKTTIMRALDESIQGDAVFGVPTHKAAEVLRAKLPHAQAERVRTMHSLVYEMTGIFRCTITRAFVSVLKTKCTCGQEDACECPMSFLPCGKGVKHECHVMQELKAQRRVHLGGHRDIVIIDESSMLSKQHVMDVREFGVPVLLVGDRGQLPPVEAAMNPWTMDPDWELTTIHRQGADSGVLKAAHEVRRLGEMRQVAYGRDAVRLKRSDPRTRALLERFEPSADAALITYTNKLRAEINQQYHGSGPVSPGDRVVALVTRPYAADRVDLTDDGTGFRLRSEAVQVYNGMTGTVRWAKERGIMTEMVVELDRHRLATKDDPVIVYAGACPTAQFGAPGTLPFNSPLRPRGSNLWDYAFALTAHKAQGSEFPRVIVIDQRPQNYGQWMYTAITRAKEAVVVIDWLQ